MRSIEIDGYEGAVRAPTINWHSKQESFVIILLRWFPGRKSVLLNPHHTLATVPLRLPTRRRLQKVSVESRLGKPRMRGDQYHLCLPTDITRVQPAAPARLHSPTRPPRHHLYQNNYSRAALPPEAHVRWNSGGTNEAWVGAGGRCCQRCGFGCYADALGDVV